MLKDITLGQFFPGNSLLHRLDPRSKLLMVVLYIAAIFLIRNFAGYVLLTAFTLLFVLASRVPLSFIVKGVKPILFFILITAVFNLFLTSGRELIRIAFLTITYEGLSTACFMVLRLLFLVFGTSVLTLTTSPIALTDGLERLLSPLSKIRFPAHELAMMMTIALRFIPTLLEETDRVIKAQTARGADFESGNILRRAKAMVPILIPLFISAFRRADELAVAMECRCYHGGEGRTHLKQLRFGKADAWGWGWMILFFCSVLAANFYFGRSI